MQLQRNNMVKQNQQTGLHSLALWMWLWHHFVYQVLLEVQNYMVNVKPEMVGCVPILPVIQIYYPAERSVRSK